MASLVPKLVKNLPAMQETRVRFLGWEDPLEKEMQPTPVFLPGEFYGQRLLEGYSPWGRKELDMTERISLLKSNKKTNSAHPPHSSPFKRQTVGLSGCPIRRHRWRRSPSSWTALPHRDAEDSAQSRAHREWTLHGSHSWGPGKERVPSPG